ncbi:MAG TPA: RDD family protein, partial [Polyangia bacterium]
VIIGLLGGWAFESLPTARVALFFGLLTAIALYEPVMVSRYGGTFGHRLSNLEIIALNTRGRLGPGRALLRALMKHPLGIFSLAFMFVTGKAQSLHDLAAGSAVTLRTHRWRDAFVPAAAGALQGMPSRLRRVIFIALYGLLNVVVAGIALALLLSPDCLDDTACTITDRVLEGGLGVAFWSAFIVILAAGWRGRLPGCRARAALPLSA